MQARPLIGKGEVISILDLFLRLSPCGIAEVAISVERHAVSRPMMHEVILAIQDATIKYQQVVQ